MDKFILNPLEDKVVIELFEGESKTSGGIVIPDTSKKKSKRGKVLAIGPGKQTSQDTRIPMETKVGDEVLIEEYTGTAVRVKGREYLTLSEKEVLCIVEDTNE